MPEARSGGIEQRVQNATGSFRLFLCVIAPLRAVLNRISRKGAKTQRRTKDRSILHAVGDAVDTILDECHVEVDEQPQSPVGQS
jgi:hypothetical protein